MRSLLCCLGRGRGGSSKSSKASSLQTDGRGSPPPGVGSPRFLLPPVRHQDMHKKCMVIDLDETLVHSSFKPINNADFVVPVEIDGTVHQVYVLKRPYVDEFLQRMGELYECVLFTASLAKVRINQTYFFSKKIILLILSLNFRNEIYLARERRELFILSLNFIDYFFIFSKRNYLARKRINRIKKQSEKNLPKNTFFKTKKFFLQTNIQK